jgi:hypothetical protein
MMNSGYSARHSAHADAATIQGGWLHGRRLQLAVVAVAGIALLAIVVGFATLGGGNDVAVGCGAATAG